MVSGVPECEPCWRGVDPRRGRRWGGTEADARESDGAAGGDIEGVINGGGLDLERSMSASLSVQRDSLWQKLSRETRDPSGCHSLSYTSFNLYFSLAPSTTYRERIYQ